jgi:hypothetical protein
MKLFRIPFIRASGGDCRIDGRLTRPALEAVLEKASLPHRTRRSIADAFADAGLLCESKLQASAVCDSAGFYLLRAVDAALAKFPVVTRIQVKSALARG